jgi:hypothetical protein
MWERRRRIHKFWVEEKVLNERMLVEKEVVEGMTGAVTVSSYH